jgi:hypothetical protein
LKAAPAVFIQLKLDAGAVFVRGGKTFGFDTEWHTYLRSDAARAALLLISPSQFCSKIDSLPRRCRGGDLLSHLVFGAAGSTFSPTGSIC